MIALLAALKKNVRPRSQRQTKNKTPMRPSNRTHRVQVMGIDSATRFTTLAVARALSTALVAYLERREAKSAQAEWRAAAA